MVRLKVDKAAVDKKSRFALVALLTCNLRLMENWRRLQEQGWGVVVDHESTMILVAIQVIRAGGILNAEVDDDFHSLETRVPADRIRKCNLSSIAATTALNRETVRRKVQNLERAGFVVRDEDGGVRLHPGTLQKPEVMDALLSQLHNFVRTGNELMRGGVIRLATAIDER
jgi:hypothetical protein